MRLKQSFLVALCFALSMTTHPVIADDGIPQNCENTNGAYYQPNLFPRFSGSTLILADWTTGEPVHHLADNLLYRYEFTWSPDCHYVVGHAIGYYACKPGVLIWDALTGEQRIAADGLCDSLITSYPRALWRTDSTAVLLSAWYGGVNIEGSQGNPIIAYPDAGLVIPLQITGIRPNFHQLFWDDARGWLWGSSHYGVTAYDQHTGLQVVSFENPPAEAPSPPDTAYTRATSSNFTFSPDGQWIILSGQHAWDLRMRPAMTVYEINSGTGIVVNVERNGAGAVAISPDNRYLVMGYDALRIWDLQNLPEQIEDRLPIYRYGGPEDLVITVQFLDNTTIEVMTSSGTSRWNILTGQPT